MRSFFRIVLCPGRLPVVLEPSAAMSLIESSQSCKDIIYVIKFVYLRYWLLCIYFVVDMCGNLFYANIL
jgi:hypothetical protein